MNPSLVKASHRFQDCRENGTWQITDFLNSRQVTLHPMPFSFRINHLTLMANCYFTEMSRLKCSVIVPTVQLTDMRL